MDNTFSNRLKNRRLELGLTQQDLAIKAGMKGGSAVSNIENQGRYGSKHIASLAKALKVNALWLETGAGPKELSNVAIGPDLSQVKIIEWSQAINWEEFIDNFSNKGNDMGEQDLKTHITVTVNRYTYALRVNGDSMEPEFKSGDIIVIEPDMTPEAGDYVIAQVGDGVTFKKLVQDAGKFYLMPLNKQYDKLAVTGNVKIIGVIRECIKRFK